MEPVRLRSTHFWAIHDPRDPRDPRDPCEAMEPPKMPEFPEDYQYLYKKD